MALQIGRSIMRDIKFKVWRSDDKKMYKPTFNQRFLMFTDGFIPVAQGLTANPDYEINEATLLQYTGIKDKNGTEIYEHDIITHSNDGMIGVVTWSPGLYRFVIENLEQTEIIADLCDYDADPEVLGNIYENEELLK